MEIGNLQSALAQRLNKNQPKLSEKPDYKPSLTGKTPNTARRELAETEQAAGGSVSVIYERVDITIEYQTYSLERKTGNTDAAPVITSIERFDAAKTAELREAIHAEILEQVKDSLGAFFKGNPEAVEQVSRGEIPEYFNVENTARRILEIYFVYYNEGEDRMAFVERAKGIIEQAYGDVEGLAGVLPDIVQKTREKVMEILNTFAEGGDVSDFMQRTIR